MKGVSTIIATILMLMITIGLAGTAYLFISSSFTQQIQGIELIDAFCNNRFNATIILRNVGTNPITFNDDTNGLCGTGNNGASPCGSVSITRTAGGPTMKLSTDKTASPFTIDPGTTATLIDGEDPVAGDTGCTTAGSPRICIYRIVPPSGRSVVATVNCAG